MASKSGKPGKTMRIHRSGAGRAWPWVCLGTLLVLLTTTGCGGGSSSTPPPQVAVSIRPTSATVATNGTQQFNATVSGSTNTAVSWSVAGGTSNGTISATGLYTAPSLAPTPPQVTVTATSQADASKIASATVNITGIGVQVLPATVTLQTNGSQQFNANVSGTTNTAVNWSVAGGSNNGSIDSSGFYTAPAAVPNPAQVTVTATSQADTSKSGNATVTVTAPVPSISVQPNPGGVTVFGTQQFVAFPSNLSSNAVTWQVNGVTGGSQQSGYINASGLYVAPGAVPVISNGKGDSTPTTVTVTAVSQVSPSVSGSATVTFDNSIAQNVTSYLGSSGGNKNDSQISGNLIYCCGGTLGSLVTRGGTQYILSNNHVLAREDQGTKTSGTTPGDVIVQPGLIDANCGQGIDDNIANLTDFYNLETGAAPKIDAAIAQPMGAGVVDAQGRILYLGATTDTNNVPVPAAPNGGGGLPEDNTLVNRAVAKSGRTTGLTCSSIFAVSTTLTIQYPKGCNSSASFTETFTNQIIVDGGSFSAPGDSGSLIVTQDTADPVALLFAGSDQNSAGNPVGPVLSYFQSGGNAMTFVGAGPHQVIGCTLPAAPASATQVVPVSAVSASALQRSAASLALHQSELMAQPGVEALGIAASQDYPGEPSIVLFVGKGTSGAGLPQEVEGIRTRIVESDIVTGFTTLSVEQTAALLKASGQRQVGAAISDSEYARVQTVHAAHVSEWMSKPGVLGVGIGSSADAPQEAALVIFVLRGADHTAIPAVIDGVRTRIRESSPFVAGLGDVSRNSGCALKTPSGWRR